MTVPADIDSLLSATNWSNLYHAYGWADDTPAHLRALISPDTRARCAALEHLNSAVIHQGTAWTSTAPAALIVAQILSHLGLDVEDFATSDVLPLSAHLVTFLDEVASVFPNSGATMADLEKLAATAPVSDTLRSRIRDSIIAGNDGIEDELDDEDFFELLFEDEKISNALFALSVIECAHIRPQLLEKLLPCLAAPHAQTRARAAGAIATLASQIAIPARLADKWKTHSHLFDKKA